MEKKPPKDPNKPKGRMSAYAFFVQACREEHRRQKPDQSVNFTEFSKKCSARWKDMTDPEKKPFEKMADNDKQRYNKEMEGYVPPRGAQRKKGKKKDPNAPKRAMSGFFFFSQGNRPKIKEKNPALTMGDISKQLGLMWGKLTPGEKAKYEVSAAKDKKRYAHEMESYRKGLKKGARAPAPPPPPEPEEDEEDDEEEEEESESDEE